MGKSYEDLFSFRIIINVKLLKYKDQCFRLIQILAILVIEVGQNSLLIICLRIFYEILSSLGADESLYFLIVLLNSSFKKGSQSETYLDRILSKMLVLTCQLWADVVATTYHNDKWLYKWVNLKSRYNVGSSQENSTRSLFLIRVLFIQSPHGPCY